MHDFQSPTATNLIRAYASGIFPMADPRSGRIDWYRPHLRGVIELDGFTMPDTLRRLVKQGRFRITCDQNFEGVIRHCARPRPQRPGSAPNETWISEQMIAGYCDLHRRSGEFQRANGRSFFAGAHSIEAWLDDALVGGLYGVHVGGLFAGESMFVRPDAGGSNSSKVCLAHLVGWMRFRGFTLLDSQIWNEHLARFGCIEMSDREYERRLDDAVRQRIAWGEFDPEIALEHVLSWRL